MRISKTLAALPQRLVSDLRHLIERSREQVAVTVNSTLVMLYWQMGRRIREDVLRNERAEYGTEIVSTLSRQLSEEFGNGFTRSNLSRMMSFSEAFPDERIVAALSQQLSWSHFVEILPLGDSLKRDFYAEMCRVERWSVRALRKKMDGLLFERTVTSKQPADIRVARYLTELPPRRLLEKKLHEAIQIAQHRFETASDEPSKDTRTKRTSRQIKTDN